MAQFPIVETFLQECKRNPQEFIEWLETQPEHAELVELADSQQASKLQKPLVPGLFHSN